MLRRQDHPSMGASIRTVYQNRRGSRAFCAKYGMGTGDDRRNGTEWGGTKLGRQRRGGETGERSRNGEC